MAAGGGDRAVRDVHLQRDALGMKAKMGLAGVGLLLAACTAPEKFVLPGKVDLPLAPGDRMRLCTDDGLEDTTPLSDCVIMDARAHPIAPYLEALKAKGWSRAEGDAEGVREVWTLATAAGGCSRLVIDAGHEKMSRKRSVIVRFDVSDGACS